MSPTGSSGKSFQELPLIVGSATAGLVFVIAVVVIAIVCFRYQLWRRKGVSPRLGVPQGLVPVAVFGVSLRLSVI